MSGFTHRRTSPEFNHHCKSLSLLLSHSLLISLSLSLANSDSHRTTGGGCLSLSIPTHNKTYPDSPLCCISPTTAPLQSHFSVEVAPPLLSFPVSHRRPSPLLNSSRFR